MSSKRRRRALARSGAAVVATAVALTAVTPVAMAGTTSPMDGVWRTEGYGSVMAIEHGRLMSYQTTAISCLPWFSARQTGPAVPGGKVTFTTEDHQVFTLWREARPGHARAHLDGSPGDRLLRRTAALPPLCAKPTPKDPLTTFDIYWQTFAENYPFFAAKGIDWQQVRDRYRPQVNAGTTDARLLTILSDMIAPLNDAHTGLVAGSKVIYHVRPGTAMPSPEYDQRVKSFIQRRDLSGPLQEFARGRIGYADLPHHLGYLRISGFTGYTDANDFAANSAELARTLDAVLTPARAKGPDALRGLILDLRVNGGGDDSLGLQIAARLTGRPYTAYAKRVRNDPRDPSRFTTPQPIRVRPAHAPNYRGPVALLTGGSTFSAGETFTQALMDRTPRPTRIGENTQGVFSDILDRSLPNGWAFGLPNEEFLTRDGRTFDGAGIPPDVRTPVFTEQEFAQNRDSSFDRAVARLTRRQPGT